MIDVVPESFGGEIVASPKRGIAAAGVANDLVSGGRIIYGVDYGSEGQVAGLNICRDGQRIGFGRLQWKEKKCGEYYKDSHDNLKQCQADGRSQRFRSSCA